MNKILCSTGGLIGLANNRNYRILGEAVQKLNCDGFEFMMYSSWYDEVDKIIDYLKEIKINIPIMHCEKRIGEAISKGEFNEAYTLFKINCDMAEKIGAKHMVIHLWDGITSDAFFDNNIQAYKELFDISNQYNVSILVENVVCNERNPMENWMKLFEKYPDIKFVFDTKMAAFHSQIELVYEKEYEWLWENKHISHCHINDYGGKYKEWEKLRTLPIGHGKIDFERFFEHIRNIGYKDSFTLEASALEKDGEINYELFNNQIKYIRDHI
jgi:sugar phosphate isomerase/epimerase